MRMVESTMHIWVTNNDYDEEYTVCKQWKKKKKKKKKKQNNKKEKKKMRFVKV